jgi:hypothetical protein
MINSKILYIPSLWFSLLGIYLYDWKMLAIATLLNTIAGILK